MSEWQPIESAPKDGRPIIVTNGVDIDKAEWAQWHPDMDGGWRTHLSHDSDYDNFMENVNHWMPLPDLPVSESEAT